MITVRHARASTRLGGRLVPSFDSDDGDPGGWVILDEPELLYAIACAVRAAVRKARASKEVQKAYTVGHDIRDNVVKDVVAGLQQIIERARLGHAVPAESAEACEAMLREWLARPVPDKVESDDAYLAQFDRKAITARFARLLDEVVAASGAGRR